MSYPFLLILCLDRWELGLTSTYYYSHRTTNYLPMAPAILEIASNCIYQSESYFKAKSLKTGFGISSHSLWFLWFWLLLCCWFSLVWPDITLLSPQDMDCMCFLRFHRVMALADQEIDFCFCYMGRHSLILRNLARQLCYNLWGRFLLARYFTIRAC